MHDSEELPLDYIGGGAENGDELPPSHVFDVTTMRARQQLQTVRWMGRDLLGYEAVARCSMRDLMQQWHPKGLTSMDDFLDPSVPTQLQEDFFQALRDLESPYSCQRLQIVFSFSIPTEAAIRAIADLNRSVVSAGAGLGYWEVQCGWLCQQRGVDLVAFDANDTYPLPLRYTEIHTGSSEDLAVGGRWTAPRWSALFLSWPDAGDHSSFGVDCVSNFLGDVVIHVGETLGNTMSADPWGQTTSQLCQQYLATKFRCVQTVGLPTWPGHRDSMTIWRRVEAVATYSASTQDDISGSNAVAVTYCQMHMHTHKGATR